MTKQEYDVHLQKTRHVHIRIDWLDFKENKLGETQGKLIDGNINITRESAVRRTCNLTLLANEKSWIPSPSSYVWLNKKFRVNIGITDFARDEIVWFNQGIFYLSKPILTYSNADKTIQLTGLDKMCLMNGDIDGKLSHKQQIELGTNISLAIKTVAKSFGEIKFNIDNIEKVTPYTVEKAINNTVYDLIKELSNLYSGWELFYDHNGYLVFRKIKDDINDQVVWNFKEHDFTIKYQNQPQWENIKNHITVWGAVLDNGTQIKHVIENTDVNNQFSIPNIGKRELPIDNKNIVTNDQAVELATWEFKKHSTLNEVVTISCLPIYFLKVNQLVYLSKPDAGIEGKYRIDKISFNLRSDSEMQLTLSKIYE